MTMTTDEGFQILQDLDPEQYRVVRQFVGRKLSEMYQDRGYEDGISSSDINHTAVGMIKVGDIALEDGILVITTDAEIY